MSDLDLSDLDDWLDALAAIEGVESATRYPDRVNTPGVLVRILDFRLDTLDQGTWKVDLEVMCIVGDVEVGPAQESLVDLLNLVRPFFGNPPGSFAPAVHTQADGSRLPALSFAHTIHITQE